MILDAVTQPLQPGNTVSVSSVRHLLALGVQWVDAVSQFSVGTWLSELEAIGTRPRQQRFDVHPRGRHALRAAGRLATLLVVAAKDKTAAPPATVDMDQTNFVLCAFGQISPRIGGYATGNDPRQYVPRRLSLTPVQTDGIPTAARDNIRSAWLWPGSTYPLASKATSLRGRVRHKPAAVVIPWTRVVVTQPGPGPANFATEPKLAFAHGDDRGEFLVVLGTNAVPGGAALPPDLKLRIWVFLPPAGAFDVKDPLASLPLEVAGVDAINDVLRGMAIPNSYVRQNPIDVIVAPGTTSTIDEAKLLFT